VSIAAPASVLAAASMMALVLAADGSHRVGGGEDHADGYHCVFTGTVGTAGVAELAAATTALAIETLGADPSLGAVGTNLSAERRAFLPEEKIGEAAFLGGARATV